MLEIHFSQLFSNSDYFKACFKARKIRLPFFSHRFLLLTTSVLNNNIYIYIYIYKYIYVYVYLMQKHLQCKKMQPSKYAESCLEVNA